MTPATPSPARRVEVDPWPTLDGWRLWVAVVLTFAIFASLPFVERAANNSRQSAAQGE